MGSESFSALGMDLGKHKGEASTRNTVWKEKMKVPSESGFLKFTFVPAFGRLPTQHHITDAPSSMIGIGGRPVDKNYQENTRNRHRAGAEEEATGSGKKGNSSRNSSQNRFQTKEHNTSRGGMDKEDLFKAEFVFFTDSDEDTKAAMRNGYGIERTEHSTTSNISPRSETIQQANAPQPCLHTDPLYSPSSHPKHAQLTSPLSTSDHPSYKSPVAHFLSPTNMKVNHELPFSAAYEASSMQESHRQWQAANGSSVHQSSTYFHSSTSSSLPSSILKTPSFPLDDLSDSAQLTSGFLGNGPHKLTETPSPPLLAHKDSPHPSQVLGSVDVLQRSSPRAVSPLPSKKLTTWSVVPISITTHLLSPSPKPLSSPLYGSSSTIHSVNNPCSQMSSSGNLLTSGIQSPLPTRLSFLTAILKSGSSPKRPFSPASCPVTLSPCSLGSSTPTIDPKLKTTPPTPKKSSSSFSSVRSASPNQDGYQLSVFSHVPDHTSLSPKFSPDLGTRALSSKRHLSARALSPDKLRPLSPTISSYRKTTVSPLLLPKSPNFSLPPHGSRKGALSPANRTQGSEKSKKISTYSPTFTAKSIPVSMPIFNQRDSVSPTSKKVCLSPAQRHSSNQSIGRLRHASAKDPDAHLSAPCQAFSQTGTGSPTPPACNINPPFSQANSSSIYSNFRACPSSSRSRTPTITQPLSPTRVHSPCAIASRSRESTSPLSFSLPSDSENKIPKIKTSYKAFAAIPTNTLLLEQKALDEPTTGEGVIEDRTLDTHSEMCSPAQLRQQTEELCAAIDQVLQDPLTMRRCDYSPSSLQNIRDSDLSRSSTPSQRSAGRETRFANLYLSGPIVTESQKTKPGVIRPTMVKAKIIVKEEEPVQPNPFKKYLGETTDLQTEQPTHPIVPIPEDEALSSKELCSVTIKDKTHLPHYQEKKDTKKENFPDNGGPHSRAQCLLRRDLGNGVGKPC
ncbi:muscular LMNA-interacting protein isoform X1 [Anolis sagrei]|uniref:muscular LMNA-interacting protein isoform X1 n=2 Tax=Anolis sagrei TaxID=38937 RepID=UPI003522F185